MTRHPDAYQGDSPADRVRAYLDALTKMPGLDQEYIHSIGIRDVVYELTASDLRALVERHDDGSVTLTRAEADLLIKGVERWEQACDIPGNASGIALVDLGCDVREILCGREARS
jgi:hypothetical protein